MKSGSADKEEKRPRWAVRAAARGALIGALAFVLAWCLLSAGVIGRERGVAIRGTLTDPVGLVIDVFQPVGLALADIVFRASWLDGADSAVVAEALTWILLGAAFYAFIGSLTGLLVAASRRTAKKRSSSR